MNDVGVGSGEAAVPLRPALRAEIQAIPMRVSADSADLESPGLEELADRDEEVFLLRDPFKLSDEQAVLPRAGLALAALLDGTRTLAEVRDEFRRRYGAAPPLARVAELIEGLNARCLLVGPHLERVLGEFARAERRAPACIGSYPGEPGELRTFLEAQHRRPGGPGAGPRELAAGSDRAPPVRALISPHIDLHRGGHSYAWGWRAVAEDCPADVFVIFGTSHTGTAPVGATLNGPAPLYALTRKAFGTPLGDVPTDQALVERLVAAYREVGGADDLFAGEHHHRSEHSIEFQTVYLAHLFAGRRPVHILPVLCGGLHELAGPPSADPRFLAFHEALRRALAPLAPERVAFVAGIDLAHVGAQFQEPPASRADLERVAAQDRETLRIATDVRDPDLLHDDIRRDGDPRNICGHAPLVALLEALRGRALAGEVLHYDQWYDGLSSVSFASAVFRDASA